MTDKMSRDEKKAGLRSTVHPFRTCSEVDKGLLILNDDGDILLTEPAPEPTAFARGPHRPERSSLYA